MKIQEEDAEEGPGAGPYLTATEGNSPAHISVLDFGLESLGSIHFCCWSHPFGGGWLGQLQETQTVSKPGK